MAETHVISALVEKRARIAGELEATQWKAIRLKADLHHVDSCIKLFKSEYKVENIAPKVTLSKNPAKLPKGVGSFKALDVLRDSGLALSSAELAQRVLVDLGREPDARAVEMLAKTIHSTFSRARSDLVDYDRSSWPGKWSLRSE